MNTQKKHIRRIKKAEKRTKWVKNGKDVAKSQESSYHSPVCYAHEKEEMREGFLDE